MTLLLVDDDEDDTDLFQEAMDEINDQITVIVCTNGIECIRKLDTYLPDIIFLDINMPMMGGRECLEEIKSDDRFKNIPVVMYSTSNNPNEIKYYRDMGTGYLHKPSSYSELLKNLKAILTSNNFMN